LLLSFLRPGEYKEVATAPSDQAACAPIKEKSMLDNLSKGCFSEPPADAGLPMARHGMG
jgi:hypothetical protein